MTSFFLLDLGLLEIAEIDSMSVFNQDELKRRERYWIEKLDTVNKYRPGRFNSETRTHDLSAWKITVNYWRVVVYSLANSDRKILV